MMVLRTCSHSWRGKLAASCSSFLPVGAHISQHNQRLLWSSLSCSGLKNPGVATTGPRRLLGNFTPLVQSSCIPPSLCSGAASFSTEQENAEYVDQVSSLFTPSSKLDEYWKAHLLGLTSPSMRDMIRQLDVQQCPFGFDALDDAETVPRGLLDFCRKRRSKEHPRDLFLIRKGDSYIAFGVDAILLMDSFLQPETKPFVSFKREKLQGILDGLVRSISGISIAVHEEEMRKGRMSWTMQQIVSDATRTYVSREHSASDQPVEPSKTYFGIVGFEAGYVLVEVSVEEATYSVSERLNAESLKQKVESSQPFGGFICLKDRKSNPLKDRNRLEGLCGSKILKEIAWDDATLNNMKRSDEAKTTQLTLDRLLKDKSIAAWHKGLNLTPGDFRQVEKSKHSNQETMPLCMETARQLGLLGEKSIPSLLDYVLPNKSKAVVRDFVWKKILLSPPPTRVAQAFASLTEAVQQGEGGSFPRLIETLPSRLMNPLKTGDAGVPVFKDCHAALLATDKIMQSFPEDAKEDLFILLQHFCPIADPKSAVLKCSEAAKAIENVVLIDENASLPADYSKSVPIGFWDSNEESWSGKIRESAAPDAFHKWEKAKIELALAVKEDFLCTHEIPKKQEVEEVVEFLDGRNELYIIEIPDGRSIEEYTKRGKTGGFSTDRVEQASIEYVEQCENMRQAVDEVLINLCRKLEDEELNSPIELAIFANLIVSAVCGHAKTSKELGWSRVGVLENDAELKIELKDVQPYWMCKTEGPKPVQNTVELDQMWVLTGPNLSGKSTLMRSIAAAVWCSMCGLMAPVSTGIVSRCDRLFVRGASSDVPTESKSAFSSEMSDVAALLKNYSHRSVVFVDEICRGTEPNAGTCLAAAILEGMVQKQFVGFFSTHLHGVLDILKSFKAGQIAKKQMKIDEEGKSTFLLVDGECRDSRASLTALEAGVPEPIIRRAQEFCGRKAEGSDNKKGALRDEKEILLGLVEETCGSPAQRIEPGGTIPVPLHKASCVYVLAMQNKLVHHYYVGETDNIENRLREHRSKFGKEFGNDIVAYVVKAEHKTKAKEWENIIHNRCKGESIHLRSQ